MRGTIKHITVLTAAVAILVLSGCEPKPQQIQFGSDQCDYCRMMITEPEFSAQTLNNQGRAFKFDSIECMAAFAGTNEQADNVHSMWVPDFLNREEWLEASSAVYLHSETLRSPMGLYLSAYADRESAEEMRNEYGGEILSFEEVLSLVEREWLSSVVSTVDYRAAQMKVSSVRGVSPSGGEEYQPVRDAWAPLTIKCCMHVNDLLSEGRFNPYSVLQSMTRRFIMDATQVEIRLNTTIIRRIWRQL